MGCCSSKSAPPGEPAAASPVVPSDSSRSSPLQPSSSNTGMRADVATIFSQKSDEEELVKLVTSQVTAQLAESWPKYRGEIVSHIADVQTQVLASIASLSSDTAALREELNASLHAPSASKPCQATAARVEPVASGGQEELWSATADLQKGQTALKQAQGELSKSLAQLRDEVQQQGSRVESLIDASHADEHAHRTQTVQSIEDLRQQLDQQRDCQGERIALLADASSRAAMRHERREEQLIRVLAKLHAEVLGGDGAQHPDADSVLGKMVLAVQDSKPDQFDGSCRQEAQPLKDQLMVHRNHLEEALRTVQSKLEEASRRQEEISKDMGRAETHLAQASAECRSMVDKVTAEIADERNARVAEMALWSTNVEEILSPLRCEIEVLRNQVEGKLCSGDEVTEAEEDVKGWVKQPEMALWRESVQEMLFPLHGDIETLRSQVEGLLARESTVSDEVSKMSRHRDVLTQWSSEHARSERGGKKHRRETAAQGSAPS